MAESLESFKSYIGKSETATDVVTASLMVKFAATLGLENPPLDKGSPIPPGWYGGLFPASHRPDRMRTDGQASGGGIAPPIPLPRRRIGGTRVSFQEPLRIGDEVTRKTEIADVQIDDGPSGAMVTVIERRTRYVHAQRSPGRRSAKNYSRRSRRSQMATSRRAQCPAALSFLGDPLQQSSYSL
ncbi:MAG: hypothetical protein E6J73_01955 [Deltaproteobacteria bacterium]|nr:MAG: hypothetical protein E6J73_01955 [Deltaproteobacteria bacterium]